MRRVTLSVMVGVVTVGLSMTASVGWAQESRIRVRSIRVLATDPEALANFYKKAFGMSETRRPVDTPTFKEIVINSGSTVELARKATSTPIVIASRGKEPATGAMAALIVQVPDIDRAIELAKAAGAIVMRGPNKSGEGLGFAFLKDPDGNQFELVMSPK
ncbi:MAG: VOC family protein [Acidimicrobiia bacterium]|nr:VOC family protein [Acidimicrobiia bacterium]